MRRRLVATVALPIALPIAFASLAGCGAAADSGDRSASAVPAGVEKQYQVLADEIAENGRSVESGEWTLNLITEPAEPWFEQHDDGSHFRAPKTGETHHIEIIPTETATGRIVPDVPITLEVVDASGTVVDQQELGFYHSTFFHYANNFTVPESGTYTLRARLVAPAFHRHGDASDVPALSQGAAVEFTEVELTQE